MAADDRYDVFLSLARDRRSVRHFRSDPIPEDTVEKMIEVARWAPSAFHSQPWEFIAVRDPAVRARIVEAISGNRSETSSAGTKPFGHIRPRPGVADAPLFILLAGDWRARKRFPSSITDKNPDAENEVFWSSLASAFLYLHLAATSLGLASQWCSAAARGASGEMVRNILGLPEYLRMYDMIAVGYEAEPPIDKELRGLREMIHYDACGPDDFRTPEEIEADTTKYSKWCVRAH